MRGVKEESPPKFGGLSEYLGIYPSHQNQVDIRLPASS